MGLSFFFKKVCDPFVDVELGDVLASERKVRHIIELHVPRRANFHAALGIEEVLGPAPGSPREKRIR